VFAHFLRQINPRNFIHSILWSSDKR